MEGTQRFTHFVGFDWAKNHHDIVVVDRAGAIVLSARYPDTAQGWGDFAAQLAPLGPLAVAVETSQGPFIDRLLDAGLAVFPVHPKAAQRYRQRKAPAGTKNDFLDAWSLADALRTDGHGWKELTLDQPLTRELRLLCRDQVVLIEQRTGLVNQLRQALAEYYPAALELFEDWTQPFTWKFLEKFPTPDSLANAHPGKHAEFLKQHSLLRGDRGARRLELCRLANQHCGALPVIQAKSRFALALAQQLAVLEKSIQAFQQRMNELFAQHPDHDLFDSLPGTGPKLGPRLLSEIGDNRDRFPDTQGLQCHAGTAPVSFQSGQRHTVRFRHACNKHLRAAVHHWAHLSCRSCAWANAYYRQKREQGQTHNAALRCLAQRWLKILWKMWHDHLPYDEPRHTRNQCRHGSWVLTLIPIPETAKTTV